MSKGIKRLTDKQFMQICDFFKSHPKTIAVKLARPIINNRKDTYIYESKSDMGVENGMTFKAIGVDGFSIVGSTPVTIKEAEKRASHDHYQPNITSSHFVPGHKIDTTEQRISDILLAFAKRIEKIPRGKTYGWAEEQAQLLQLVNEARIDEHHIMQHQAFNVLKSSKAVGQWSELRVAQLKGVVQIEHPLRGDNHVE